MRRLLFLLPSLAFLGLAAGCDSADADVPDVSGLWSGTVTLPNAYSVRATFDQSGRSITGTMRVSGVTPESAVVGEIDDLGRMTWEFADGCDQWSGTLTLAGGELSGPVRIDRSGCATPQDDVSGTLRLTR